MTATAAPRPRPPALRQSARGAVAILLILSLLATAVARHWVIAHRLASQPHRGPAPPTERTSLNNMPSYATALLLGGLRGPLAMPLWISSQTQLQQGNLQDLDTKIEWIRLLQPEFDAVHLFQIWNKAYNISVKMTSLSNKYSAIIDAIDYGQKVDLERPDDINILSSIALTYSDKLGNSQESAYYRRRVRRETQTLVRVAFPISRVDEFKAAAFKLGWLEDEAAVIRNQRTHTAAVLLERWMADSLAQTFQGPDVSMQFEQRAETSSNPSWRLLRLPAVLDDRGYILSDLLEARYPRPAALAADQPWYDGSQLQMLAQYQPFPYGLSTFALGYNDYKRCQLLQDLWNEHPMQSNEQVIDGRPAIMLELWAKDEWERGRRFELRMVGAIPPPGGDPVELEAPTAAIPASATIADQAARGGAEYSYGLAARLFADARAEFRRHMNNYRSRAYIYFSHVDDAIAMEQLMLADRDYLRAVAASGAARQAAMQSAITHYTQTQQHFALVILRYWVDELVQAKVYPKDPATGKPYTQETIESADPSLYLPTLDAVLRENNRYFADPDTGQYLPDRDQYREERGECLVYVAHCKIRLANLQPATRPATTP